MSHQWSDVSPVCVAIHIGCDYSATVGTPKAVAGCIRLCNKSSSVCCYLRLKY